MTGRLSLPVIVLNREVSYVFSKKKKINEIDMSRLPQHIGIIMDGNGRWAKKRGLPRSAGHSAGADSLKKNYHRGK